MTPPFALFTYIVTFCITLFVVLPLRLKPLHAVVLNAALAGVVTLGIYWLVKSGLVPVRNVY